MNQPGALDLHAAHPERAAPWAARIRAARAFADMRQEDLAQALGVDVQTIKRREAGAIKPRRGELLAIALVCGVPPAFLEQGFDAW